MQEPYPHLMMPCATHDEVARQNVLTTLRIHLEEEIYPGDAVVYERKVKPEYRRRVGREPANRHEVRRAMVGESHYQTWSALTRNWKEMLWDAVGEIVERQLPELIEKSRRVPSAGGTLRLDEGLPLPRYYTAVDIHFMPGNYHTDLTADDVYAGALYERAGYYVVAGPGTMSLPGCLGTRHSIRETPKNFVMELAARGAIRFIKQRFPDLSPRRILDLGCAVGTSTLPYLDAFPGAEVFGVDLAAPQLRYGHARAEGLGKVVHFSQQNAERTDFDDGQFDLVVSHALAHETSASAIGNIMRECHRLLAPGGVTVHSERRFFKNLPPREAYLDDWDTYNDNEPFKGTWRDTDTNALLIEAGFEPSKVFDASVARGADGSTTFLPGCHPDGFGAIFGAIR